MTSKICLKRFFAILSTIACLFALRNPVSAQDYYKVTWRQFYELPVARQPINLRQPDYALLDAAFFHATNEAREKLRRRPFSYALVLHRSAAGHSENMIRRGFYDHKDRSGGTAVDPHQRIRRAGGKYQATGENIAEYGTVAIGENYCPQRRRSGEYAYLNCRTQAVYESYSYVAFARRVVDGWMRSPGHRRNILSDDFQYLGCAARLSRNPYTEAELPFARMTQNFGGQVAGYAIR